MLLKHLATCCGNVGEGATVLQRAKSIDDVLVVFQQVFASCSVDRTIRIWNTQQKAARANVLTIPEAHSRDINVINWNSTEKHLLASGGDDGIIKIWDLRMFQVCGLLIIIIIIIAFKGAIQDFCTISSQRRELSPTRTLKWPRHNRVQIMRNTSSAYHVQVSCYVSLGTKGQLSY